MNKLTCDALLFDLDGVLIDSSACIVRHWQTWADLYGIDIARIMQVARGTRSIETIQVVAPHLDAVHAAEQLTVLEVADTDGVVPMAGARQLLEALPVSAWTIVTLASLALAAARLRTAGLPVPAMMVTAEDVQQGKPAPEPYLLGARRLGVVAERCLVVEDAPAGIQIGRRAAMRVLAVGTTHTRQELLAAGATVVVDRLRDRVVNAAGEDHRLAVRW